MYSPHRGCEVMKGQSILEYLQKDASAFIRGEGLDSLLSQ